MYSDCSPSTNSLVSYKHPPPPVSTVLFTRSCDSLKFVYLFKFFDHFTYKQWTLFIFTYHYLPPYQLLAAPPLLVNPMMSSSLLPVFLFSF